MQEDEASIDRLIGVYDADGGLLGEAAYVWGKLRGTRHCALCDITHSPLRRKPAWDALVARLGLPFELLHLNELPDGVRRVVTDAGAPVVLAAEGTELRVLLGAADLDALDGSVSGFEAAVRTRLGLA
jgi:hypothetical protein